MAKQTGLALTGYVQAAVWGDYNDGLPDLFLSRRYGPALLYRNNGKNPAGISTFSNVLQLEPSNSFVTWFWDLITMAARIS